MRLPGFVLILLTGCYCLPATAQQSTRPLRGSWVATAGSQTFHGRWTGQAALGKPDAARGTWELTNASGVAVMKGTWSAEQQSGSWQGTFLARSGGGAVSGRWTAYLEGTNTKTLQQMLQRAMEKEVSGAWDAGAQYGTWSLGR